MIMSQTSDLRPSEVLVTLHVLSIMYFYYSIYCTYDIRKLYLKRSLDQYSMYVRNIYRSCKMGLKCANKAAQVSKSVL